MRRVANGRWKNATLEERRRQGEIGQAGLIEKLRREIDPDDTLPPDEVATRLQNAKSEHFGKLGEQKGRLERRRREQELRTQSKTKRKAAGQSVAADRPAGETTTTTPARTGQEPQ